MADRPREAFWRGKRVLLTGHTGFKGAWAALWLSQLGARVTGLSLPPAEGHNLFDMAEVDALVASHLIDLRDPVATAHALADQAFDLVLHLAAQPIVSTAVEDPLETFGSNIMGTANLLQALRAQPRLQAILVITSDKVYANNETGQAFREGDALGGKDPYSASKAAADIVASSFARSYFEPRGVPLGIARAGNVVGGGDFARDRLMADIVRAAASGEPIVLRHPEATRPWQHVLDCVAGYLAHIEALATWADAPRTLNFGPAPGRRAVTVGELATLAAQGLGAKPWRHEVVAGSLEAQSLSIDAGLAAATLGFASRLDPREAIELTVDWHRRQAAGASARRLCFEQIAAYEAAPLAAQAAVAR